MCNLSRCCNEEIARRVGLRRVASRDTTRTHASFWTPYRRHHLRRFLPRTSDTGCYRPHVSSKSWVEMETSASIIGSLKIGAYAHIKYTHTRMHTLAARDAHRRMHLGVPFVCLFICIVRVRNVRGMMLSLKASQNSAKRYGRLIINRAYPVRVHTHVNFLIYNWSSNRWRSSAFSASGTFDRVNRIERFHNKKDMCACRMHLKYMLSFPINCAQFLIRNKWQATWHYRWWISSWIKLFNMHNAVECGFVQKQVTFML